MCALVKKGMWVNLKSQKRLTEEKRLQLLKRCMQLKRNPVIFSGTIGEQDAVHQSPQLWNSPLHCVNVSHCD